MGERTPLKVVIDHDEYGNPVRDEYKRLGAGSGSTAESGLYVRFEPGFGLNVIIGLRYDVPMGSRKMQDFDKATLGIEGWERLCVLVDEWRAREAPHFDRREDR